jgi:hypothetical protein
MDEESFAVVGETASREPGTRPISVRELPAFDQDFGDAFQVGKPPNRGASPQRYRAGKFSDGPTSYLGCREIAFAA